MPASTFRRAALLCGLGCTATLVLAAGAPAAPAATGAALSSAPVTLRGGDEVELIGTKVRCAVSSGAGSANPTTLICGEGDDKGPLPGSYSLAFADSAALVLMSSPARKAVLVRRAAQPATRQPSLPAASRTTPSLFRVGNGALLLLGGTDVLCGVSAQAGGLTLTCGLAASGAGTFVIGSYFGVLSEKYAVLSRLLHGSKGKVLVSRRQPKG